MDQEWNFSFKLIKVDFIDSNVPNKTKIGTYILLMLLPQMQ